MPTYDYRCDACGHELELFQSMTEAPKRKCPACGKLKLVRLIGTGGGLIFKGAGFYLTDYRSDSYKEGAQAEKKASEPAAKTDSGGGGAAAPDAQPAKPAQPSKPPQPSEKGAKKDSKPK